MKRSVVAFLVAVLATLSVGLCACGSSSSSSAGSSAAASSAESSSAASEPSSGASASSESAAASSVSEAASTSASASSASATAASSTVASSGSAAETASGAGFDFEDKCIDEHGNITLYALTELKGWMVATLLDQQGYKFNDNERMWLRQEDGASFAAVKETGPYTIDTYNEMNEKGGAIAAMGLNVVAGYKDPQEALKGNAQCVVEDSFFDGTDGIAIFYGPTMKEYLAIISKYSESTALFMIFSKEAVASGMADQYLNTQVGGSFQEVWKTVTGKDSYGH